MNRIHRTIRRAATAVSVAAVLTVALGAPAQASGAGLAGTNNCSGLHCFSAVITVDIQDLGNGSALVAWYCEGTGTVDAASTSITKCSLDYIDAPPMSAPGPFAATGWTGIWPKGAKILACVGGQSTFVENVLGALVVSGPDSCSRLTIPKIIVHGGGPS